MVAGYIAGFGGCMNIRIASLLLLAAAAVQGQRTQTLVNQRLYRPVMTSYWDVNSISAPSDPGSGYLRVYAKTGSGICWRTSGGVETCTGAGGDVYGPASAVSSNFAGFDGTTGKLLKDSGSKAADFATIAHVQALDKGGTNQTTWTSSRCVQVAADGTKLESAAAACGSGGGGALAVQLDGAAVGTESTLNFVTGAGITLTGTNPSGKVSMEVKIDTAAVPSKANLQSATNPTICTSASASGTTYTATCATTLAAYASKQTLYWWADADNTGADPTLNIDTLGAKTMKTHAGAALSAAQIKASTLYRIWYDGTYIRVVEAGLGGSGGGLGDPGSNGIVKRTALNTTQPAVPGTDYAAPVSAISTPAFWLHGGGLESGGASTAVTSANRVYYEEFLVFYPGVTITKLVSYTYTNASDVGYMAWGIYDASCNLISNGNSDTVAGTGSTQARAWTFPASLTLTPGRYFFGYSSENVLTQFYASSGGLGYQPSLANLGESGTGLHYFYGSNASTTNGGTTTMPSACGTRTATNSNARLTAVMMK